MARAHHHANLSSWVVMGENAFAQSIADMLNRFGDSSKIMWLADEKSVDEYLQEVCPYA